MRSCPLLLLLVCACGSGGYQTSNPVANGMITIGNVPFTVSNWYYRQNTDPNAGKLTLAASNGNTCALMADPNGVNTRLVQIGAFVFTSIATGATTLPKGPGQFPIQADAVLGNGGAVFFHATGPDAEPLVLTNTANPTAPVATDGNVILTVYEPQTQSVVDGSALGTILGTRFNYTFTAQACP